MINPEPTKTTLAAATPVDARVKETLREESQPTKVDAQSDFSEVKMPLTPRVKARREESIEFKADVSGKLSFVIPEKGTGDFARKLGKFYEKLDENQEYPMNFVGQGAALKITCKSPSMDIPELYVGSAVFARVGKTVYLKSANDTNGREIKLNEIATNNNEEAERKERNQRDARRMADGRVLAVKKTVLGIFNASEISELKSSAKMSNSAQKKITALEDILVRIVRDKVLQEKVAGKEGWGMKYAALELHARKHETISPYLDTLIMALDPSIHSYHSLRDTPSFVKALAALRKGPGIIANLTSDGRDKNKLAPVVDVLLTKLLDI